MIHRTLHATLWRKRQPATTSGVAIWVGHHHALSACRHDPAWRNTGLRTAATPRGVANYLASCHRLRRQRRVRAVAHAPGCSLRLRNSGVLVPRPSSLSNP
ncbi:MAG: hypothetical protein PUG32_04260 [Bacteroidales bacterium]|nr:hypothetical protein [Bacteroidales bacterium]